LQAAALSPDGDLLIVACIQPSYTVGKVTNRKSHPLMAAWHTRSREVQTFAHRHKDEITDIAFSSDGSRFATASSDKTIRVWNAKSFKEIGVLRGSESRVESLCWSPDGRRIVAGADAIRIWDVSSNRQISVFQFDWANDYGIGFQVCYSPDGTRIAASLDHERIFILDAKTGEILVRTVQPAEGVDCICFSPDGERVVYSGEGGPIVVSDARTGATCCQLLGHDLFEWHTTTVCYLPDGKRIASGSSDGTIRIWAVDSEAPAANLVGVVAEETEQIAFIDAGKRILSVSTEQLCIWDGQNGIRVKEFQSTGARSPIPTYARICAQFWPSSNEHPASLRVWEPWSHEVVWHRKWKDCLSCSFDLSPNRKTIAFTELRRGSKYVVRIFDIAHGKELFKLKGHDDEINDVRFSTNGVQIATASSDFTARVWDAATGESLIRIDHEASVRKVWFSPDGAQIVTLSDEDVLRVFDTDGGIEYFVLEQNVQSINDVYFSPDGTRIAVAASVGIFIWDATTGKLLEAIPGHGDIQAIAAEDYIQAHHAEVMKVHQQIEERNSRGNPPDVQAKLDTARTRRLEWLEQQRNTITR
jgi:WD40 repeat protein